MNSEVAWETEVDGGSPGDNNTALNGHAPHPLNTVANLVDGSVNGRDGSERGAADHANVLGQEGDGLLAGGSGLDGEIEVAGEARKGPEDRPPLKAFSRGEAIAILGEAGNPRAGEVVDGVVGAALVLQGSIRLHYGGAEIAEMDGSLDGEDWHEGRLGVALAVDLSGDDEGPRIVSLGGSLHQIGVEAAEDVAGERVN